MYNILRSGVRRPDCTDLSVSPEGELLSLQSGEKGILASKRWLVFWGYTIRKHNTLVWAKVSESQRGEMVYFPIMLKMEGGKLQMELSTGATMLRRRENPLMIPFLSRTSVTSASYFYNGSD